MAILLDPSAVIAAADAADLNHRAAVAWFERVDEPLLLGALGLAELDILLQRELGSAATAAVLASVVAGSIRLVAPTHDDLSRAVELHGRGRGAPAAPRRRAARRDRRAPLDPARRGVRPAPARGVPAPARAEPGLRALNRNGAGDAGPVCVREGEAVSRA